MTCTGTFNPERNGEYLQGETQSLEQAMGLYSRSAPVHWQSKTDLIVSHTSAPPSNDRLGVCRRTDDDLLQSTTAEGSPRLSDELCSTPTIGEGT